MNGLLGSFSCMISDLLVTFLSPFFFFFEEVGGQVNALYLFVM